MHNYISGSILSGTLSAQNLIICSITSVILGLGIGFLYRFRNTYNKGFLLTLTLLPPIVQLVIMMVNGNIGAGMAVAGAFSLVRFRSVPGNARDITNIFFAMAIGLTTGMGYLGLAIIFFIFLAVVEIIFLMSPLGTEKEGVRILRMTIPENLDYENVFDEVLNYFTESYTLQSVRTVNLGSLFELQYQVELKDGESQKEFIDKLRTRNGNLTISLSRPFPSREEL
ncbi:putative membrane protein YhiD involved in acid resistance [Lachnospiraceae bacterium PF1-21]